MLGVVELTELEQKLQDTLAERLLEILTRLNRTDKLNTWLELMELTNLLQSDTSYFTYRSAKILVIGESQIKLNVLKAIIQNLSIDFKRFELCLDYNDTKSFNFNKLRYNSQYSLVLVGAMPHKTSGTGDFSSAIARMEQEDGFPPVVRFKDLKITKTTLKEALQESLNAGYITAA
ncbi:putative uncharacterized protein [Phascolarctobacterium sp. CAG:266]|nr:putative uncharacterized protein [Phascolarctobacterium sp. CAG:266]